MHLKRFSSVRARRHAQVGQCLDLPHPQRLSTADRSFYHVCVLSCLSSVQQDTVFEERSKAGIGTCLPWRCLQMRLLPGPEPRTSNVWQTSMPGWGRWDFMPFTSVCISKEAMVVTVIPVVACTATGHRSPQSFLPLILVLLFVYGTTHSFSVAQTVVMEY